MLNLLEDPIIPVQTIPNGPIHRVSFPELLAMASTDQIENLPGMRWHQLQAWHSTTVQLAVIALTASSSPILPQEAPVWRRALANLTQNEDAWHLVQEDPTVPAFMQPPITDLTRLADYKTDPANRYQTPDDLDPVYTGKAHELKPSIDHIGDPSSWLYSLINLQTAQHYSNAGAYGISRMAGRIGGRPMLSLTPSLRFGRRFARDTRTLLDTATEPAGPNQPQLIWTIPWHGAIDEQLDPTDLGPHYIDNARRLRLVSAGGRIHAIHASSKGDRIKVGGNLADPWAPLSLPKEAPLVIPPTGFSWELISGYLHRPNWRWPLLLYPNQQERMNPSAAYIMAQGFSRDKGKVHGHYSYVIPLTQETMAQLAQPDGEAQFRATVEQWLNATRAVRDLIRPSLHASGYSDYLVKTHTSRIRAQLQPWIEERFWVSMQSIPLPEWQRQLGIAIADLLHHLAPTLPASSARRPLITSNLPSRFTDYLNRLSAEPTE